MKQFIPFKRFEYAVPFPDTYANRVGSVGGSSLDTHLPQLKVSIDFEKRELYLEGKGLFEKDNERIRVQATISSGFHMNLSEFTKDELVFSLDGSLDDGKTIDNCSGLLVFGKKVNWDGSEARDYHLTLYLYDDFNDEREIKLGLTMYAFSEIASFN